MNGKNSPEREIRIALVLYGGVSLAIYENGITRCFYDLYKERGIFSTVLKLLDSRAVIDVIAGTSAGGINGLALAAAIESGTEFSPLSECWRRLGDLGTLMNHQEDPKNTDSILDGKYFLDELEKEFKILCTTTKSFSEYPGEMDVFITGTDLDGHTRKFRDNLGTEINDKEHRVVFHLQHRPDRKSLGNRRLSKSEVAEDEQAAVLSTIARITAGFPVAFTPIQGDALLSNVQQALKESVHTVAEKDRAFITANSFIDGGVLDNKPFGPALRAIFFRMPEGIVDRRLFYIEPDPEPQVNPERGRDDKPTPFSVALASIVSIPGHESISDDLEKLLEHNERARWLKHMKDELCTVLEREAAIPSLSLKVYNKTRIDCIARSLALNTDVVPSATDYPVDTIQAAILDFFQEGLARRVGDNLEEFLDPFDVVFHMRHTYYLLDELYKEIELGEENPRIKTAMILLGRIMRVYKIILDSMINLRDKLAARAMEEVTYDLSVDKTLNEYIDFLRPTDNSPWARLLPDLKSKPYLASRQGSEHEFLKNCVLMCLRKELQSSSFIRKGSSSLDSILTLLSDAAKDIFIECGDKYQKAYDCFRKIDVYLYPIEFSNGIYDFDEVEFVRISPVDANVSLIKYADSHEKVAGDKLAHFSAFLRRDWRSNDILQGRLDGTCQIIRSLLTIDALARFIDKNADFRDVFREYPQLRSQVKCSPDEWNELDLSWQVFCDTIKPMMDDYRQSKKQKGGGKLIMWPPMIGDMVWEKLSQFIAQLIKVGQIDAFSEDIDSVFEDLVYQEIKFGNMIGPLGTKDYTDDIIIKGDAEKAIKDYFASLPHDEKLERYKNLKIGSQKVVGNQGKVPFSTFTEYMTAAYLNIWEMVRISLGKKHGSLLDIGFVKLIGHTPAVFLFNVLWLARKESILLLSLLMLIIGVLSGFAVFTWNSREWWYFTATIIGILITMALANSLLKRVKREFLFKKRAQKHDIKKKPELPFW